MNDCRIFDVHLEVVTDKGDADNTYVMSMDVHDIVDGEVRERLRGNLGEPSIRFHSASVTKCELRRYTDKESLTEQIRLKAEEIVKLLDIERDLLAMAAIVLEPPTLVALRELRELLRRA